MTEAEYRSFPALSGSILNELAKSPSHYRAAIDAPRKESAAMALGSAAHKLILEGREAFAAAYEIADLDRRTKAGKEAAAAIEASGKEVLSPEDADACEKMLASVKEHPAAKRLLFSAGRSEVPVFVSTAPGVSYKGKIDRIPTSGSVLVDLKTTKDISDWTPDGAALQMAHYLKLVNLTGDRPYDYDGSVFVVVETSAPYAVRCVMLDDQALESAKAKVESLWELYASCVASGEWPKPILGEDGIEVASLKPWTLRGWA